MAANVFVVNTLVMTVPMALAAIGGMFSERSGVMNIALEGKMLMGACTLALVGAATGNPWIALGAAMVVATIMSLIHAVLTQIYKLDHVVSGMAINALALGSAKFLSDKFLDASKQIAFLPMEVFVGLGLLIPFLTAAWLRWTRGGLRLMATGSDPEKCRQIGLEPVKVRYESLIVTGVLCGIAGSAIVTNAGQFGEYVTAGKGFMALAALILGGWRPLPTLLACLGFGVTQALQLQLQGSHLMGASLPSEAWNATPYLVTLLALIVLGAKNRAPAGLGKP
ncbi:MAG: ABC transporter permease [Armatimonadetes bacterium]|nr:ABC transporter permease [Armatimonadota bacterium]